MKTMNIINIQKCRLFFVVAACVSLFSCSNESDIENTDGNVLFFASVDKPKSRVTESAWDGDELIGVKSGETVKTYKVATDGTMSTDDAPFRWEGTVYEIQAWSPLTTEQINLTDQTTEEKFFDCDLLASSAKVEYKNVKLAFSHKMTRMWWELQKFEGYTDDEVNNANITFLGYGATTYVNGELSPIGEADKPISTYNTWGEYYRNGQAMMIPCEMWEKPLIKVEIGKDTYVYTPSKSNQNDVSKKTGDLLPNTWQRYYLSVSKKGLVVDMESSVNWSGSEDFGGENIADAKVKPEISQDIKSLSGYQTEGLTNGLVDDNVSGFSISYTDTDGGGLTWEGICTVERTEVPLSGENSNATTHIYRFSNIESKEITISYLPVKVGQYFYNNGTWGNEAEKEGLETLGRVFYAGKNDNDKSEYSKLCKVRGYVVCTIYNDDKKVSWVTSSNDSEYISCLSSIQIDNDQNIRENDYSGQKLTNEIDNALTSLKSTWNEKAPFWYAFKNIDIDSPDNSSGWYIPSVAQIKDAFENGCYEYTDDDYWSSQIYVGTGDTGESHGIQDGQKTTIWAIKYNSQGISYGWSIDSGKLILVLTF